MLCMYCIPCQLGEDRLFAFGIGDAETLDECGEIVETASTDELELGLCQLLDDNRRLIGTDLVAGNSEDAWGGRVECRGGGECAAVLSIVVKSGR